MASIEDLEHLLDGIGKGERANFRSLYALTSAKLFGLCETILDDRSWAAEVLERVYLRLWHDAMDWRADKLQALTWVLTVARSEAVMARRSANHENPPDPVELQKLRPPPKALADGQQVRPLLRRVLAWLPSDRREAFMLIYFSGVGYVELATRYRVPLATVRNWQRRSLERLYLDLTHREASADVVAAGEYVLDLLPAKEKKVFENRLAQEEGLSPLVSGWCEDFLVLTDSLPEIAPPPDLFAHLDQTIFKEQSRPIWWRVGVIQSISVAAIAAAAAWAAYTYWPGMVRQAPDGPVEIVQQGVTTPVQPVDLAPLPETGPPLALIDPPTGFLQVGGDLSALRRIPNLSAFLDFGRGSEWVALGDWSELPPHILMVPVELISIVRGSELVLLGGEGSDQEILRITVQ
jgi:RNA polymerase sigma-70 factor (ECF subfamily)